MGYPVAIGLDGDFNMTGGQHETAGRQKTEK